MRLIWERWEHDLYKVSEVLLNFAQYLNSNSSLRMSQKYILDPVP